MADESRRDLLKRLERRDLLTKLEAADSAGNPTPSFGNGITDQAKDVGAVVAKGANSLWGTTTGPIAGKILEYMGGHPSYNPEDVLNSINPTNLKTFPTLDTMLERQGVPKAGSLSDLIGGYAEPGTKGLWPPNKGGPLDPTLRGSGAMVAQQLLDPATWLTGGTSSLLKRGAPALLAEETLAKATAANANPIKKLLASFANSKAIPTLAEQAMSKAVLENANPVTRALTKVTNPIGEALSTVASPVRVLTQLAENVVGKIPYVGPIATAAAQGITNPLSMAAKQLGRGVYGAALEPITHEDIKMGRWGTGDRFYNAGIKIPYALGEQTSAIGGALTRDRDAVLKQAGDAGGRVSMEKSMAPAQASVDALKVSDNPVYLPYAKNIQNQIDEFKLRGGPKAEIPEIPTRTETVTSPFLDSYGKPITHERVIPGTPGVPAVPETGVLPINATGYKSAIMNTQPGNAYSPIAKHSWETAREKEMGHGLKTQIEEVTGNTLGDPVGEYIGDTNKDIGALVGNKKAKVAIEAKNARLANSLLAPNGTSKVLGSVGYSTGDLAGAIKALLGHAVGATAQLGTLPAGYGLQKLGQSRLTGPALEYFMKQRYGQTTPIDEENK